MDTQIQLIVGGVMTGVISWEDELHYKISLELGKSFSQQMHCPYDPR